jgi:transmembrane sensor
MKEQYTSYSAIQLAGEDNFIAWVLDGTHTHEWEAWLQQHTTVKSTIDQARRIVLDMVHMPEHVLSHDQQHGLWDRIATDIARPSSKRKISKSRVIQWTTVAAAAAIVLFFWISTSNIPTTVNALAGEHKEIQLPESSAVQLNAGSSVVYDAKHFNMDRQITLTGEAFFKVHPGSRFVVNTVHGSITVLGTSFNVIAWPDRFEVTCYTGKVMVNNRLQDRVTITPGERCTRDEATFRLKSNTFQVSSETPDWMGGKFVFDNQPLKIVTEELERQYNITVKLAPGLDELKYVGLFESGDLDKALSLITWPLHLKAEKNGNTILIGR